MHIYIYIYIFINIYIYISIYVVYFLFLAHLGWALRIEAIAFSLGWLAGGPLHPGGGVVVLEHRLQAGGQCLLRRMVGKHPHVIK